MTGETATREILAPDDASIGANQAADGEATGSLLEQYLARGGTLRALMRIDTARLEVLYAYGCQRFEAGNIEGARQIFFALTAIDPQSFDYWLALGMSMQKLQRHDEAIYCFARASVLRIADPRSSYLAAVSFQLQGCAKQAIDAYSVAVKWCGRQQMYRGLRELAITALAALEHGEDR